MSESRVDGATGRVQPNRGFSASKMTQILLTGLVVAAIVTGFTLWGFAQASYSNAMSENATLRGQLGDLQSKLEMQKTADNTKLNVAIATTGSKASEESSGYNVSLDKVVSWSLKSDDPKFKDIYLASLWPEKLTPMREGAASAPNRFIDTVNYWKTLNEYDPVQLFDYLHKTQYSLDSFPFTQLVDKNTKAADFGKLVIRRTQDITTLYKKMQARKDSLANTFTNKVEDGCFKVSIKKDTIFGKLVVEYSDSAPGSILPQELFYPAHRAMYFKPNQPILQSPGDLRKDLVCTVVDFKQGDLTHDTTIHVVWESRMQEISSFGGFDDEMRNLHLEEFCIKLRQNILDSSIYK